MAIVRLDKMQGSYNGNLEHVVHTSNMTNGLFINLGALVTGERELRQVATPATATLASEEVLLVAHPEVMYDERLDQLADFFIKSNTAARAYHLHLGDIFTLTTDLLTGTPAVNKFVIPANGSLKGAIANDLSGGTRFAAKIIEKDALGFLKYEAWVLQVVKI